METTYNDFTIPIENLTSPKAIGSSTLSDEQFPNLNDSFVLKYKKIQQSKPLHQEEHCFDAPNVRRKLKHTDPVLITFDSALKECSDKTKEEKRVHKNNAPSNANGGNTLDSSKPIRKRGKFREIPKKKLSMFKKEIIRDRTENAFVSHSKVENVPDLESNVCSIYKSPNQLELSERLNETMTQKSSVTSFDGNSTNKRAFSSNFRPYCTNALTKNLNNSTKELIESIVNLQDRAFDKNAVKAKMHKRHVCGLHEILKYLNLKKLKIIIIPPDLEGVDTVSTRITVIKNEAKQQNIPCVFALSRRKLGYYTLKKVPVSGIGILNYDGRNEQFQTVMGYWSGAQDLYHELFAHLYQREQPDDEANSDYLVMLRNLKM